MLLFLVFLDVALYLKDDDEDTNVCDAWPVPRQTDGYLPSRKASPPLGWYQIILLGDGGTCV